MKINTNYSVKDCIYAVVLSLVFCALLYVNILVDNYIVDLWASRFLVVRILLCRTAIRFCWAVVIRICIAFWRRKHNYTGELQLNIPALLSFAALVVVAVWDRSYGTYSFYAQSLFAIPTFTVLLCTVTRQKTE